MQARSTRRTRKHARAYLKRREISDNVRRRYRSAVAAAREASARRREEILHDLEEHGGGNHAARGIRPDPDAGDAAMNPSDEQTSTEKPVQR